MIESIRNELLNHVDESYRKFQSSLIPGVENFLGVRRPVLRKMAAGILKENGRVFLKEAGRNSFEEILLRALVIGGLSAEKEEILNLTKEFIPQITDWCICDTFCNGLKAAKEYREEFWEFLTPYLTSEKEFEARFAAVMILEHYICDSWIDQSLGALYEIRQEGYYAQMAVAWAYSMCFVKYPEKTERFLQEHRLPEFTYKKTISKINDSLPVPREEKERIRKYGFGTRVRGRK